MSVLHRLIALLNSRGIEYDRLEHPPVFTSEEAARVRGTTLASGAKALICKADERFVMFVIPADRKLDNRRVRQSLGTKHLRFATADEVLERTTLRPGSIPPFGSLFGLPTHCDRDLAEQSRINFNAGDHSVSIRMNFSDYLDIEQPVWGQFAEPAQTS